MYIHEIKRQIAEFEDKKTELGDIINTIRSNGNSLPIGRPREMHGAERFDEPDGIGFYKAHGLGANMYSIGYGEYMLMAEKAHVFPEEVIKKYEEEYQNSIKKLEKLHRQLARAERKVERQPATAEQEVNESTINKKATEESTREQLEVQLNEIEKNHEFIRKNTTLIVQSNSLLGKIKRFLGDKKILGFGDVQKRAEQLERAIHKEKEFIDTYNGSTYDEALNVFKYGRKEGQETIKLVEYVGPHDDYNKMVGEVTLKPFDYICDELGKRLHKSGSIHHEVYAKMKKEYAPQKVDKFTESLQMQVNEQMTATISKDMEGLLALETGARLHDGWRAPRRKEDGTYEPRIKPTNDKLWISKHGAKEVDIANTPFESLPSDWQLENLEAGKEAVRITGSRTDMTQQELRDASIAVHEAWCDRKRQTIEAARQEMLSTGMLQEEVERVINEKFGWDMGLMVSFDELSPEEQQKDTEHILTVMQINKEIEAGEIKKSQMVKKFGDITDPNIVI